MENNVQLQVDINYEEILEQQTLFIAKLLKEKAILGGQVQALGAKVINLEAEVERYRQRDEPKIAAAPEPALEGEVIG